MGECSRLTHPSSSQWRETYIFRRSEKSIITVLLYIGIKGVERRKKFQKTLIHMRTVNPFPAKDFVQQVLAPRRIVSKGHPHSHVQYVFYGSWFTGQITSITCRRAWAFRPNNHTVCWFRLSGLTSFRGCELPSANRANVEWDKDTLYVTLQSENSISCEQSFSIRQSG